MRVDLFDFDLPQDLIAQRPVAPRDAARLLDVTPDGLHDRTVRDLPSLLRPGDLLVFNDTKVIPARLLGDAGERRQGRGAADPPSRARIAGCAFARPGKRLKVGDALTFGAPRRPGRGQARRRVDRCSSSTAAARELMARHRERRRDAAAALYPRRHGRCARPRRLPDAVRQASTARSRRRPPACISRRSCWRRSTPRGIAHGRRHAACRRRHLPAGEGRRHRRSTPCMPNGARSRRRRPTPSRRARGRRSSAIGTTALRLLEIGGARRRPMRAWTGETDIFITPGYRFQVVDLLLTNFHLPRSTLFMLVSAFAGLERMKSRLCARHRRAIPLLFLRRCLSA